MRLSMLVRLVCAGLVAAALPAAGRAADLPYIGSLTSTTTSVTITPEGFIHYEATLAGSVASLGSFTGTAYYDVNPATGAYAGGAFKKFAAGTLSEVLVGQFNATFTGSVGQFWFVGGTGRLRGAGGGGLLVSEVTSAVTIDVDFVGVLQLSSGGGGPRR
jgi:hypothetical protein